MFQKIKYIIVAILLAGAFYSGIIFQREKQALRPPICGDLVKTSTKCKNSLEKAMQVVRNQRVRINSLEQIVAPKKQN